VVTHAELMALGVARSTICRRMRSGGPWQWILPGVVLCHTGIPTQRERLLAALKYGGPGTVITGTAGMREHGVRERLDPRVHVLIPHDRHRSSHHFLIVERTRVLPDPVVKNGLALAPLARCCLDGCRRRVAQSRVRAAIAEIVQRRMCTPSELRRALATMATQRSGDARTVMREIEVGVRSAAEGDAFNAFRGSDVPMPEWNVSLYTADGVFLCSPDGWWDDLALALQIDSMEWHLSPALYKRTQATQRALAQIGIPFLPWAPGDVSRDPQGFLASAQDFRAGNANRPRPDIIVVRDRDIAA
ncbi:MAG: hypothetical protein ACRDXB_21385, partial [Actinomycetes bacterium]